MSQTPSQDPVDLIQINDTAHDITNASRLPSPNPNSPQDQPPSNPQPQTAAHEPLEEDSSTHPRSSSLPAPSSKTDISSAAPTDTNPTQNSPNNPTDHTQSPPEDLGSSKDPLEAYDWTELEERFYAEMENCEIRENGIQAEFNELLKLFKTYTSTISINEENRAGKRLRTRIAYVQHREKTLEEKRTHYVKVVKAFESALELLGGV